MAPLIIKAGLKAIGIPDLSFNIPGLPSIITVPAMPNLALSLPDIKLGCGLTSPLNGGFSKWPAQYTCEPMKSIKGLQCPIQRRLEAMPSATSFCGCTCTSCTGDACSQLSNMCSMLKQCEFSQEGITTSGCSGTFDATVLSSEAVDEMKAEAQTLAEAAKELDIVAEFNENLEKDNELATEEIASIDAQVEAEIAAQGSSARRTSSDTCSNEWGQCGGVEWKGPTCCGAGLTCNKQSEWYSQCIRVKVEENTACAGHWKQCGGIGYTGPTCCSAGLQCEQVNEYWSHCIGSTAESVKGKTVADLQNELFSAECKAQTPVCSVLGTDNCGSVDFCTTDGQKCVSVHC